MDADITRRTLLYSMLSAPFVLGAEGVTGRSDGGDAFDTSNAWPMPGYDTTNSGTNPEIRGIKRGGSVRWSTEITNSESGLPVTVADGKVLVAEGGDGVHAYDHSDGEWLWDFPVPRFDSVLAPPVTADGVGYIGTDDGELFAFDLEDGRERWNVSPEPSNDDSDTFADPLMVAGGTVYARGFWDDYAIDADTGSTIWQRDTSTSGGGAPAVVDGTVYLQDEDLYFIDAVTGDLELTYETRESIHTSPVYDPTSDQVYVGTRGERIHALDGSTGERVWTSRVGDRPSELSIVDGSLFVSAGGTLCAFDGEDGREQWRVDEIRSLTGPTVADGVVYVCSQSTVVGFDSETGEHLVSVDADIGNARLSAPALVEGMAIAADRNVNSDSYVVATEGDTERLTGRFDVNPQRPTITQPVVFDAAGSDTDEGTIQSYQWDLDGDGTFERDGESVEYTYDERGEYEVTLLVSNSEGQTHTVTRSVFVSDRDVESTWEMPGYDTSNRSSHPDVSGPGEGATVLWSKEITNSESGLPVTVADGKALVAEGEDGVQAYDCTTGEWLWEFPVPRFDSVLAPPVTADGVGYIGTDDGELFAFDLEDGRERWNVSPEPSNDDSDTFADPLMVAGGTVYARGFWDDYAVDAQTGATIWQRDTSTSGGGAPAVVDGTVYLQDEDLYFVDAVTGDVELTYDTQESIHTSPVYDPTSDQVYVGTRGERIHALDGSTGERAWTSRVGDRPSELSVAGDFLFVSAGETLYALDREEGGEQWRVDEIRNLTSPTVADGVVYVCSQSTVVGFDSETGEHLVSVDADIGNARLSAPALVEGMAIAADRNVNSDSYVVAVADRSEVEPPTAAFSITPNEPAVDEEVTFDAAESSSGDEPIDSYEWAFGESTDLEAAAETVTRSFDEAGTVSVTSRVVDERGRSDTTEKTVTVGEADRSLSEYADEDGIIGTDGLRDAIDDWRGGETDTELLREVIDAWRSGDPVEE